MKRGLVSPDTVEINLNKFESLRVYQDLMGRILDYGDLTVVGTGASLEPLHGIARPLELRKKLRRGGGGCRPEEQFVMRAAAEIGGTRENSGIEFPIGGCRT